MVARRPVLAELGGALLACGLGSFGDAIPAKMLARPLASIQADDIRAHLIA